MTANELCEVFSTEISKSFELSIDVINQELLRGIESCSTEQAIIVKL